MTCPLSNNVCFGFFPFVLRTALLVGLPDVGHVQWLHMDAIPVVIFLDVIHYVELPVSCPATPT